MKIAGKPNPYFTRDEWKVLRWSINRFGDADKRVYRLKTVKKHSPAQLEAYIDRMLASRRGNEEADAHARVIKVKLTQHRRAGK
jgi:hypothetical protein